MEKALGPEHPRLARTLNNYARLLGNTGRSAEAARLIAQASAIRAKHARENPQRKGFLDRLFGR